MTEFEIKLEIPAARLRGVAASMRRGKFSKAHLTSCYFDTADGYLASRGVSFRLRREGERWVQTVKAPSSGLLERFEHNVIVVTPPDKATPNFEWSLHKESRVAKKVGKALKLESDKVLRDLIPVYKIDVMRLEKSIKTSGSIAKVALDQGHVFCEKHSAKVCEVEFELIQGRPEHVVQLARKWCSKHQLWVSTISKSMKGQRLRS